MTEADGIRDAVAAAARALEADDADAATGHFIDYWTGPGSWAATPQTRRPAIVASVRNVRHWAHALMTESTPISAFGARLRCSHRVSARGGGLVALAKNLMRADRQRSRPPTGR